MASLPPTNPYLPATDDEPVFAPFAGRQRAFDFLYQQLTDPAGTETSLILGRRGLGKSALLHHFGQFFDETIIGVYIPLAETALTSEADWLRRLADGAARALAERNYTLSRLPEYDGQTGMRAWFTETYLPEVLNIVRRHRRLVYLLDDADALLRAIDSGNLPDDSLHFLHSLVQTQPQFGVVLTLDTRHEDDIPKLSPLVTLEAVFRLANLSQEETQRLLNEPAQGFYQVTPEAAAAVHRATGGQPQLLQRFGAHLFRRWEANPGHALFTPDDVKQITPAVYGESEAELRAAWDSTTRNERLALTAIISLIYADPLGTITPADVESWLVETDYPLDSTAINAAIRGLEYRELVEHTAGGIRLTSGLMQSWLLEHGRLSQATPQPETRGTAIRWLALAGIAALVIVLLLIAGGGGEPPVQTEAAPVPTVTLVTNP